jgi:hypothetical protein
MRVGGMPPPVLLEVTSHRLVTFFQLERVVVDKTELNGVVTVFTCRRFLLHDNTGPALITVTGVTVPSGAKICVMPIFLPMIPLIIFDSLYCRFQLRFQ